MKKKIFITALFLFLAAATYAAVCDWQCVFCGLTMVSGCGSPPPSSYCDLSKNHQHLFVLKQKY